jgi:hypothetical protein
MPTPSSPRELPAPAPCPECGGMCVHAYTAPYTLGLLRSGSVFRGRSRLRAVACTSCGLTRLYAQTPSELMPKR